jgi:hypothetical protein
MVWLYYAIRLVVPSHTFPWEKIWLTYQPSVVPIAMHGTYEYGILFLKIVLPVQDGQWFGYTMRLD